MENVYFGYKGKGFAVGTICADGSLSVLEYSVGDTGVVDACNNDIDDMKPAKFRDNYEDVRGKHAVFDGTKMISREDFNAQVKVIKKYVREYFLVSPRPMRVKYVYKMRNEKV